MSETLSSSVSRFSQAKAEHTAQMQKLNGIRSAIARCEKERETAIANGQEAESSWRTRFRDLRGAITPELRAEHSQRIASRELAGEFAALTEELETEKQWEMIRAVGTGRRYVNAHHTAFTEYAESQWDAALRSLSPALLRAIRLKLMALTLSDGGRDTCPLHEEPTAVLARLTGDILTKKAASAPLDMEAEPVLSQIGLHRPALTGVDMNLYNSPASCHVLSQKLKEKKEKKA